MASNVVVIDSTARRATVKTTPGTNLSEVLEEACRKLGYKPEQYGLKHNNKQVDLTRPYRLSGLAPGAKLELVQLSKSTGVVSVALQLPESEAQGVPNARLSDKFPSNTTLWLLLRKFEAGVAGGPAPSRNFTARGNPSSGAGAGRLYYEQPVVQIMNRELSTFTDLQKTLAQLGLNSGSSLMRLSFKPTERPLEDALEETQAYFDSLDAPYTTETARAQTSTTSQTPQEESSATKDVNEPPSADTAMSGTEPQPEAETTPSASMTESTPQPSQTQQSAEEIPSPTSRPVSIYRPPTGITPSAALTQNNEADFTPTIEHAQAHQKMLTEAGRNRRLKTDAELAAQAKEEQERLAAITEVEVKVRFPDQSALGTKFRREDTGTTLYTFVREECLDTQVKGEPFVLGIPGGGGRGSMEVIPDTGKRLIQDLHLKGRVLLVFAWDEKTASATARGAKSVLKAELRARAQDLRVPEAPVSSGPEEKGTRVNIGGTEKEEKSEGSGSGIGKKMPKWLKGLNKK
ncbi:uncharacterized protein HMPREF1541_06511 [Cyphellophora europaea CBS 101466]|uniref:UBX domain-containing protein n=1 Tax=Cyphellophora europaea (strain CBS 101466) TaxID=1220924 RepID=W2RPN8_CYPE1|nr:uncharacterized protein HMPREF1541_06511 [Cyphellophora europaea CBS 101466]ETN38476.1 hypothetical protein HMPREF1541_06511 [Cyphellophora europaea CBS 101466]